MNQLLAPMLERSSRFIGVELEYPLIKAVPEANLKKSATDFLQYMVEKHNCTVTVTSIDKAPVRIRTPTKDCISFDFHYGQIEFSMWRSTSLTELAGRFFRLYRLAQDYLKTNGCLLTGMGTNPLAGRRDVCLVEDNFTSYISDFMKHYTSYHDNRVFFTNMYSNQTHLDVEGSRFLRTLNLMLRLDFTGVILFANSLPNQETLPYGCVYPPGTVCARDFNWKYSEFPAVGCPGQAFKNMEELAGYLADQEMFLRRNPDTGEIIAMKKTSIREYFQNPQSPDEDLKLFRMFANVSLNHYHTLEIRSDCIQPITDTFAPNAFHLGIAHNLDAAEWLTESFFRDNNIRHNKSRLRMSVAAGQRIVPDHVMKKFLEGLIFIARAGLVNRGYGEERYLKTLTHRIETLCCPAQAMLNELKSGVPLADIIAACGQL